MAPVAMFAAGALVLSACTGGSPNGGSEPDANGGGTDGGNGETSAPYEGTDKEDLGDITTAAGDIKFSVGGTEWQGYNGDTPQTYSTYTSVVNMRIFSSFIYFGTDGTVYSNEELGTYEVKSEEPLQVEYQINDEAVWSDGEPIDYVDYLLDWASQNPEFVGDDDKPLFNSVSHTYGEYVPSPPEGEFGGKTFTIEYKEPYPDWELIVSGAYPAHIVAEQIGVTKDELGQAILDEDMDILAKAGDFWSNEWLSPNPGELPDPALTPSSGPYKLDSWVGGESLTITANENYWGTPAATEKITYRFLDPATHVQALENRDLDVIEPQATVDTLEQLEGLGEAVAVETGDTLTWEHLDFNFEGPMEDLAVREAFAMCVPRQQIVDNLIKPINPDAVVMNAREVFPFQDNYEAVTSESYDGRYDEVDIEGAKKKLEDAGITEPIKVRIGYAAPNPRRTDQVSMIKSSCDEVGLFEVEDTGSEDFFDPGGPQERGDWEVALFAWAGSGQKASGRNIYHTKGAQNWNGFSSEVVDAAWDKLASTTDEEVHAEQLPIIEKGLWDELHGMPIFAHPGVVAYQSDLQNVRQTATQDTVVWNAEQWLRVAASDDEEDR